MTTKAKKITLTQARRVLEIVDAGLVNGLGNPQPGMMCVEAAVCYALGQPHGDEPKCVHPAVRSFKIALNDKSWSSPQARAKGMRRIAIAQLGSADQLDESKFIATLAELTIRRIVPIALRAAASVKGNSPHKDALELAAVRCEKEGTKEAALGAKQVARAAAYAAAAYAADADAAAYAAAYAADAAAAYAADAAAAYAYAAYAAAYAAAAAAYADAKRDEILSMCAEIGVEALRAAGSPGIKLMDELIPSLIYGTDR